MPGRTHYVCPQYASGSKCFLDCVVRRILHAQTESPFRAVVVLCLNGAKPLHHIGWFFAAGGRQVLVMESMLGDVQNFHIKVKGNTACPLARVILFSLCN